MNFNEKTSGSDYCSGELIWAIGSHEGRSNIWCVIDDWQSVELQTTMPLMSDEARGPKTHYRLFVN